jgi:hypothetical protein
VSGRRASTAITNTDVTGAGDEGAERGVAAFLDVGAVADVGVGVPGADLGEEAVATEGSEGEEATILVWPTTT